jgi:hypothetical protein
MALRTLNQLADVMAWLQAQGVNALTVDSRAVAAQAGQTAHSVAFVAWPGAARRGQPGRGRWRGGLCL